MTDKTNEALIARLKNRAAELKDRSEGLHTLHPSEDLYDAQLMRVAANTIKSLWRGVQTATHADLETGPWNPNQETDPYA